MSTNLCNINAKLIKKLLNMVQRSKVGLRIDIAVKEIHSLQNPFDEHLEIIEVQKGDILEEDDIIRYEDMYGRC